MSEFKSINVSSSIEDINGNFSALKKDIDDFKPNLYDIDLYNIQGQIRKENMSEMYSRLPYNSALIWFIPLDSAASNVTFLGNTYSNGDYILKLGNDKSFQIHHDTKGTFKPKFDSENNILTYTYLGEVPTGKSTICTFTLPSGKDGTNAYFSCTLLTSSEELYSIDTGISSSVFMPIINFFLNVGTQMKDASDKIYYESYSDPILIDYYISVSNNTWWVTLPDGNPSCIMLLR